MVNILQTIYAVKKIEVAALKKRGLQAQRQTKVRPFMAALKEIDPLGLIAEIKKASPSKGLIRQDFQPDIIAKAYQAGGANCLSVLTDENFFQGKLDFLKLARNSCDLPVIRKDFLIDFLQIEESYQNDADAILLIAAILAPNQLKEFYAMAKELGLDVLVEVHNFKELEMVLEADVKMIGINNRDLRDFRVSLETTKTLASIIPKDKFVVSESGIFSRADIDFVCQAGAHAVLVGESLMRQADVTKAVKCLLNG